MQDFLTGLTALNYGAVHVSNTITALLWGRKHLSVLFVPRLAQGDAGHSNTRGCSYSPQLLLERKAVLDLMIEGLHP